MDQRDYAAALADFSLPTAHATLHGSLEHGLNACVECCDRHTGPALHWEATDGTRGTLTFAGLQEQAARMAGLLVACGIQPGDVVAGMLPRTPALLATILGVWRAGAVYQPLFTAFGPKAIEHRLGMSGAWLVVTDAANRGKLDEVAGARTVAIAGGAPVRPGDIDVAAELPRHPGNFAPVMRRGSDLFLMMSTSGTTGLPKGVPVPLAALPAFAAYMRDAVDLRASDRFWNLADPGWAYGLYYAVTGPLLLGHPTTFYEGGFSAASAIRVVRDHAITNLAGSPTAFRLLMAAGAEAMAPIRGQLRAVSSAGEPLNPEVIRWFAEHLAVPVHDHYGQTELGMVVNNFHGLRHPVRPGSAGFPSPGIRVAVLDDADNELPANQPGVLAVDLPSSPMNWFTGYVGHPATGRYYRTGDTVEWETDGRISFVGRSDDVITSSGYRIGPFDVESALIEHPAVIEAAVVGKPDPERTEIVKAFVVLAGGFEPSSALAEELQVFVKRRLSAHAFPREVEFMADLPKTPSGKVQRFMLRARDR